MKYGIPKGTLELFARIPREAPAQVATILDSQLGQADALRRIRRLEQLGLVEIANKRPKTVKVASTIFPRALHGILSTRPYFLPLLGGNRLTVLSALATAEKPLSIPELAQVAGLHENTVRPIVQAFLRRSLLAKSNDNQFALARHVPELKTLGIFFRDYVHERILAKYPTANPILQRGAKLVLESDVPIAKLQATAFYRFQREGADVLAPRYQYVVAFDQKTESLSESFQTALALNAPPRTAEAMKAMLEKTT